MVTILNTIFKVVTVIIEETMTFLVDLITEIFSQGRKTEYDADFIPVYQIMSKSEKGFCLDGKRCLSIGQSYSNGIVYGGSGSGKSTQILIPSVLKMAGNAGLIIHDPSKELFEKTSGALSSLGYTIKVIDYSNPERSEGFNPFQRARSISDIQKITGTIVRNTLGESKDPFWNRSSEAVIALFSRYLINHASPEYRTLHNVLYLINTFASSPAKVDKLIVRSNDDLLIADYKAFVAYENRTLMGIIATARAALSIFSDPSVATVTAHDSIDFEEFRKEKVALYINNSVRDMRYYSPISSIFFEQFWGEIMSRIPGKDENPVFFLMDEASSLHLGSLPTTVSNIRKSKAGVLLIYQDYNQVIDIYGHAQARAIAANCYAKIYMCGQPITIAQELETTLGKFEYEDDDEVRHIRPLMTADEIRLSTKAIILCGNQPAIHAQMTPYYEQWKLRTLSDLPPCDIPNRLPFDTPPLIQFNNNETGD